MTPRARILVGLVAAVGLLVSGCGYRGLNSVVLPGAVGTGADSYVITAEFASASNLVSNSEVKVDDVTVGTVRSITLDGWHAKVSIGLRSEVVLPANTVARIGQKSLLGAPYVELAPPSPPERPTGQLRGGDVIPLARTDQYPETEQLLAGVSLLLNGGGLAQVHTITTELNNALGGNEQAVRELLSNLNTFVGTLDDQRGQIVESIQSLDRLAIALAAQRDQLATAIEKTGPGLRVLNERRVPLINALNSVDRLSVVTTRVLNESGGSLRADLHNLHPVLEQLDKAGDDLPNSLDIALTLLAPASVVPRFVKGDYANLSMTLDLSLPSIAKGFFPDTPVDKALTTLRTALQAGDPLTGPFTEGLNHATETFSIGGQSGGLITPDASGPTMSGTPDPQPSRSPRRPGPEEGRGLDRLRGLLNRSGGN